VTNRREFTTLLGAAAAWPLAAHGQQPDGIWRIGYLRAAPPPERNLQAFLRALAEKHYVQGQNFVLISQWGDGRIARLPELAVALVNANVDIIVTEGTLSVRALHAVTATVPIVMTGVADPYVFGIVKDLSKPGGNITGFSTLEIEIAGKQLELLKEMVPRLDRVAILAARQVWPLFSSAQNEAAKKLSIDLTYVDMASPDTADAAMQEAAFAGAHAAVLRGTPFFSSVQRKMIVDVAAEHRLPMIFESREFVEQGGLVSYAADASDLYRLAAGYIVRILGGAKAGDLPIQQATKFELVLSLKTAKMLGLETPTKLLVLANEVIE
jgi:putative tryptophan/tyrosine transport system substrate-binding protein